MAKGTLVGEHCSADSGPTLKGDHVFVSVGAETGVVNAAVSPGLFEAERLTITQEQFLQITGSVQTQRV